jgi:hypothetical protein
MSVCLVVAVPLVLGSWPAISAAILAGGAALGYTALSKENSVASLNEDSHSKQALQQDLERSVQMTMSESQVVADSLLRGESFSMQRGDVQATFRVDGRGACQVHISGKNMTNAQLEAAGVELMDRVRQQFAYSKVMQEMEARGFQVQSQEVEGNQSIRIRVKRI